MQRSLAEAYTYPLLPLFLHAGSQQFVLLDEVFQQADSDVADGGRGSSAEPEAEPPSRLQLHHAAPAPAPAPLAGLLTRGRFDNIKSTIVK